MTRKNKKIKIVELNRMLKDAERETRIDGVITGKTYRDLSTVIIVPTRGMIHCKVVSSWWSLITPMNQKHTKLFAVGMEVGRPIII